MPPATGSACLTFEHTVEGHGAKCLRAVPTRLRVGLRRVRERRRRPGRTLRASQQPRRLNVPSRGVDELLQRIRPVDVVGVQMGIRDEGRGLLADVLVTYEVDCCSGFVDTP